MLPQVRQHGGRLGGILFELDVAHGNAGNRNPKSAIDTRWQVGAILLEGETAHIAVGTGKHGDGEGRFHGCVSKLMGAREDTQGFVGARRGLAQRGRLPTVAASRALWGTTDIWRRRLGLDSGCVKAKLER